MIGVVAEDFWVNYLREGFKRVDLSGCRLVNHIAVYRVEGVVFDGCYGVPSRPVCDVSEGSPEVLLSHGRRKDYDVGVKRDYGFGAVGWIVGGFVFEDVLSACKFD